MAHSICVDGLFLHPHHRSVGVSRYLLNVLREMERIDTDADRCRISVLVPPATVANGSSLSQRPGFQLVPCPAMRLRRVWRLGLLMPLTRRARADTLFLPSPIPIYLKPTRLAVTMHDVIPLLFPDKYRSF